MCYNACGYFSRYSETCQKPRGMPCPEDYDSDDAYQSALAEAEFYRDWEAEMRREVRNAD